MIFYTWFLEQNGCGPVALAIIAIALFSPWCSNKANYITMLICAALYALCELFFSLSFRFYAAYPIYQNWLLLYGSLFVGGPALCIAIGRALKWLWIKHQSTHP